MTATRSGRSIAQTSGASHLARKPLARMLQSCLPALQRPRVGHTRRIEDIAVGEQVWAWDEAQAALVQRRVTRLFRRHQQRIVEVLYDSAGGLQRIACTPEHPFWVRGCGWVPARLLVAGDPLAPIADAATLRVSAVRETGLRADVYNIEVEGTHNYFVGARGVLVHNQSELPPQAPAKPGTIVLLHGFLGWGRDELDGRVTYWGGGPLGGPGDLQAVLQAHGHKVVTVAVGPVSSAWDRGIEAAYQLIGGRVDYGVEHAARFGHARFGREYEALLPGGGAGEPLDIVAHSFGGATALALTKLLRRDMPGPAQGLPRVRSVSTFAAPLQGTTLTQLFNPMQIAERSIGTLYRLGALAGGESPFYDLKLDQWKLPREAGETWPDHLRRVGRVLARTADGSLRDLSPEGAPKVYGTGEVYPDVYYYSFANQSSVPLFGHHYPGLGEFLPFAPQSIFMGRHTTAEPGRIAIDASWFANDGVVNVRSMRAPSGLPVRRYDGVETPGIWTDMGLRQGLNHLAVVGIGNPGYADVFVEHAARLAGLK